MRFAILERLRFALRPDMGISVVQDALDLIEIFGAHAAETAAKMAWREKEGLIEGLQPNHWRRVKLEVDRQSFQPTPPSPAPLASRP